MQIRVYYDDTHAGGIVYHANYLKMCGRAWSEAFFQNGRSPVVNGGHFVVRHIEADFIKPAKLGDLLDIKTELLEMRNASLVLKQSVLKDDLLLFCMTSTLAYAKDGKPTKIDEETKAFFKTLF